jgi:hypothetical protein
VSSDQPLIGASANFFEGGRFDDSTVLENRFEQIVGSTRRNRLKGSITLDERQSAAFAPLSLVGHGVFEDIDLLTIDGR